MRAEHELTPAEQAIEAGLRRHYAAGDPDPAFVARLEGELRNQVSRRNLVSPPPRPRLLPDIAWGWRLLAVDLALFILITLAVVSLGPQRVWAEMGRMLRYVPGIGFVDLSGTRVLPAPVEVTRDGVTVRIEQVVAEPDRTRLVVRSFGLPLADTVFAPGSDMSQRMLDFSGRLRLPDDTARDFKGLFLQYGEGASQLEFAALPAGVLRFTLELDRLPLVPPGVAPEGWRIPLTLVPADASDAAPVFPEPYRPDASDTHHGVTLSVESAAHTADETAISVRAAWSDPALEIYGLGGALSTPSLFDNVGHVYGFKSMDGSGGGSVAVVQKVIPIDEAAPPTPTPTVRILQDEVSIEPLSAFARELTLQLDGIQSEVALSDTFRIDIPAGAQVGDRWPLDVTLDVAGFPVRLTGAALETDRMRMAEGQTVERMMLSFTVAAIPDRDGRRLSFFYFEAPSSGWGSGPGSSDGRGSMTVSLELQDGAALRPGPMDIRIRGASVILLGPWRMTWPIPGREGQVAVPALLYPQARDTHDGLTLAVKDVVHTDRLTSVLLDLQDAPPGVKLAQAQVTWVDERLRGDRLDFRDDRGRRYEPDAANIRWLRPGETYSLYYNPTLGAQSVRLPPVDPLAHRFTLTLPAIEVIRPVSGSFTVTVPAGIELKDDPRAYGVTQRSDPWPVDVTVRAGGQTGRFTQAMLTAQGGQLWVVLGNGEAYGPGDSGVSGLCNLTITGPDGQPVTDAQNNYVFSPGPCAFAPGFAANDATGRLVPGQYRVSYDGVAVRVAGPWKLVWEVGAE